MRGEGPEAPEAAERALPSGEGAIALRLGDAEFGLPLAGVREVLRPPPITRVPQVPPAVCGVTSVRGDIVPVVDLGLRLLDEPAERPGRLVVVTDATTGDPVALLVDAVAGLVQLPDEGAEQPPAEAEASLPAGMAAGVVAPESGRVVTILDLQPVLAIGEDADNEE